MLDRFCGTGQHIASVVNTYYFVCVTDTAGQTATGLQHLAARGLSVCDNIQRKETSVKLARRHHGESDVRAAVSDGETDRLWANETFSK